MHPHAKITSIPTSPLSDSRMPLLHEECAICQVGQEIHHKGYVVLKPSAELFECVRRKNNCLNKIVVLTPYRKKSVLI